RFPFFTVHFTVEEHGRRGGVEVTDVVMDLLVVPLVFAGFGVEGDDRGGEEVVAFAFRADPRGGVGGREGDLVRLRVDRSRVPERGAAVFVGAVVGPGVATRFLRRRGGVEAPVDLAGLR